MIKVLILLLICFMLSGCFIQGTGRSVGYVTSVEDASLLFNWGTVWFRVETGTYSSMQSSPDVYVIDRSNKQLIESLAETSRKNQIIEITYNKHFMLARKGTKDEIINFKVLER